MPSKGLKTLVNLEEEALAAASTITTKASTTKKTSKVISKEVTSQSTTKVTKTKEKITKFKNSKSKTLESSSTEECIQSMEQVSTAQELSKEKLLNCVDKKDTVSKNENKDEKENLATSECVIKAENAKVTSGKKSAKVKTSKRHELIKQKSESMISQNGQQTNCKKCDKPVYKMEEVKAEKQIYHKNCFRCNQCDKQLKVDNYQSHEGVLYCIVHFKLLFAPKYIEDQQPETPHKPELIIRENQPAELPPDVVRASEKPNLGLDELHQLNLRSRFQVFEKESGNTNTGAIQTDNNVSVRRSTSILAKMAKITQQKLSEDVCRESDDEKDGDSSHDSDENLCTEEELRQMQREQPLGLGDAMNDIRTRFEQGYGLLKEERREERKQEIQNIRSRLFMGKQARIKEMYQQAVAQSAKTKRSNSKQLDIEVEINAHSLKERFERGEINNDDSSDEQSGADNHNVRKPNTLAQEAEVFEYGISKTSRSIFMELDANVKATNQSGTQLNIAKRLSNSTTNMLSHYNKSNGEQENIERSTDIIKCNEAADDVVIKTAEISEKFKFFEKYQPVEEKRREFRITPPREGVVKMPSSEQENNSELEKEEKEKEDSSSGLYRSNTTAIMLSKFRQLEQNNYRDDTNIDRADPRPLKRFTPPPEGEKQYYTNQESDYDDDNDESDDLDEEDEEENYTAYKDDEALREARAAARAKQLRLKFEKWQSKDMSEESQEGRVDVYSLRVSDDTTIESAKVLRERFENMKNSQQEKSSRPKYQVKRFV